RRVLALPGAGSIQRGEALGLLGLVCVNHGGDTREGLEHLGRAQQLAKATGDRLALANACMLAGNARLGLGQLDPARDDFSRYALLCQELGLPDEALCASLNLAQVAYEQGRFVESWQRARAGAQAAREMGNKIYEAFGLAYVTLAGCQLGYLTEAEDAGRAAQAVADELGLEAVLLQVGAARLEAAVFLGRLGGAEEQAVALRKRAVDQDGAIALSLGVVYALSGETAAAIEQLRLARIAAERSGNQVAQARVALGFGQVALASGQIAVAHARAQDALALAQAAGAQVALLRAHLLVAQTAWQLGRPEATEASLAAAQAIAAALPSPHWQAIAWMAQSRFCPDGTTLRLRAATHIQFYLQQLPPRARQEFLNWPERRDALSGRGTGALELRVPAAPMPFRETVS
ncbi:MAG: MalT-like region, partial [Cyanobacteria bacterium RYN_339]|nr:MalT-like region [Cyanobacteria bacterium RYN_339]